ncbi:MAG TPA: DEAD/DEAH box helicase, partial [Campylobacterales bacterium]|nr:DEAD/DEAH box helicase [Campylobacterales bacterium]
MLFLNLNLSKPLQQLLQTNNYKKPTPIQEQVIPLVLEKQDIMAHTSPNGFGEECLFCVAYFRDLSQDDRNYTIREFKAK